MQTFTQNSQEQEVIVNDLLTIQRMTAWITERLGLMSTGNHDLQLAKSHIEQSMRLIDKLTRESRNLGGIISSIGGVQ